MKEKYVRLACGLDNLQDKRPEHETDAFDPAADAYRSLYQSSMKLAGCMLDLGRPTLSEHDVMHSVGSKVWPGSQESRKALFNKLVEQKLWMPTRKSHKGTQMYFPVVHTESKLEDHWPLPSEGGSLILPEQIDCKKYASYVENPHRLSNVATQESYYECLLERVARPGRKSNEAKDNLEHTTEMLEKLRKREKSAQDLMTRMIPL